MMLRKKFKIVNGVGDISSPFSLKDIVKKGIKLEPKCKVIQYTGLKDKNGVEIYEGDILNLKCSYMSGFGTVSYDCKEFVCPLYPIDYEDILNFQTRFIEVVGSIYITPDFFK